jgi:predicted nucleic acid-binding protein
LTLVALLTAVDSSILLDVLTDDATHSAASLAALRKARSAGALLACPIVWAEVRGSFKDPEPMLQSFAAADIRFDPFDRECAEIAGEYWREYRRRGGARSRLIADFLIGAHAQVRGGRLLTRDRGFFRRYFSAVQIIAAE